VGSYVCLIVIGKIDIESDLSKYDSHHLKKKALVYIVIKYKSSSYKKLAPYIG